MNTAATSILPHALFWLHMLICSVHPSVALSATAWIQLRRTHCSLCYPRPRRFFFVLVPILPLLLLLPWFFLVAASFICGDATVVWPNTNRVVRRERAIKREEVPDKRKRERDEWVTEMKHKSNGETVQVQMGSNALNQSSTAKSESKVLPVCYIKTSETYSVCIHINVSDTKTLTHAISFCMQNFNV